MSTAADMAAYTAGLASGALFVEQESLAHTTLFMSVPERDTNIVCLTNSADCTVELLASAISSGLLDRDRRQSRK